MDEYWVEFVDRSTGRKVSMTLRFRHGNTVTDLADVVDDVVWLLTGSGMFELSDMEWHGKEA